MQQWSQRWMRMRGAMEPHHCSLLRPPRHSSVTSERSIAAPNGQGQKKQKLMAVTLDIAEQRVDMGWAS